MKKVFFCLFILIFFCGTLSFSLIFKYNQKEGRKYRFKNQVIFDVYQNSILVGRDDQMNKAVLELVSVSNGLGDYHGKYSSYSRTGIDETYKLNAVYDSYFYQDERGRMTVSPDDIIPSTRSIPAFPDKDVKIGESWNAPGEEIFENIFRTKAQEAQGLYRQGSPKQIYKVKVEVSYQYLSNIFINNTNLALLSIDYGIIYKARDPLLYSITLKNHNLFYWNIADQSPYFYSEDISILYTARNGKTVLYKGNSASQVEEVSDTMGADKAALIRELSNQISVPSNGMNVRETNDGIIVNLGNILFEVNQFDIKKDYEAELDRLADILQLHPQFDIEVSGHTDNTGKNPYNSVLSENRAKAVTDYLVKKGVAKSRISYAGYGPDRPIADNSTPAGRALNRRVEVKIITKE